MNTFITLYEKVNDILQRITPGFGYEVTQEEYFIAAKEARYSPLDAENLLKHKFVNICRKLTADSNEKGSIENMIHIMDDELLFTFETDNVGLENEYADLQDKFERSIAGRLDRFGRRGGLIRDLRNFLRNLDSGVESGIFNAPADVDPNTVSEAISNYDNFIKFLRHEAHRENLENIARGRRKSRRLKKSRKSRKSKKPNRSKKSRKSRKSSKKR